MNALYKIRFTLLFLHHVSWIKMLSTAKTSENDMFSEVFCCFSGKNGTFTHPQNRFRFCAVF